MEEMARDELAVCQLCGVEPKIQLGFDHNHNYYAEVGCSYCGLKVESDNIESARRKWNEHMITLAHALAVMGWRKGRRE